MALSEAQVVASLTNAVPNGGEVWIALSLNGVELSDPGYSRAGPYTNWTTFTDGTPANARRLNGTVVSFGPFTNPGEADTAIVIDTAAGSGIAPAKGELAGLPVTWSASDTLDFAIGDLSFGLGL